MQTAASRRMEQSASTFADGHFAAGMDETEQQPTSDAGRSAAAPLIRSVSSGLKLRLIRTSLIVGERVPGLSLRSGEVEATSAVSGAARPLLVARMSGSQRIDRGAAADLTARLERERAGLGVASVCT